MSRPSLLATWEPGSWRGRPVRQQPEYAQREAQRAVEARLADAEPLVTPEEIRRLQVQLAEAEAGRAFFLQAGDCAERFCDAQSEPIRRRAEHFGRLRQILAEELGSERQVFVIGRIAGQYGKPRTNLWEGALPAYRGDLINGFAAEAGEREPDPQRQWHGYQHARRTHRHLRRLMASAGWDLYTSHEGLLLGYEEALTRYDPRGQVYYNRGAHTLWIGVRTRGLDDAHVEYFRGLSNPIAVKVGPQTDPDELVTLVRRLNPLADPGRLTLVTRLGHRAVAAELPPLIAALTQAGLSAAWCCDPVHGNGFRASSGHKTRAVADILREIQTTIAVHREMGSTLAGLHLELTPEPVTECLGGIAGIGLADLPRRYETYCDPRLNGDQSAEVVTAAARALSYLGG